MNNWEILGIAPTKDEDEIRRAYMMQLGQHHPEDDPEGFAKLRAAYEAILRGLEEDEEASEEEVDDTPVSRWMERVTQCYEDYPSRISEDAWKELLEDEVCYQLDETEEASEKLLVYLMDHFRLPHRIWVMLDQVFHWEENKDKLYQMFPTNFINFVRNCIIGEDRVNFDLIEVGLGVSADEVDQWIEKYFYVNRCYDNDNIEELKKALEEIKGYDIYYPKIDAIEVNYLMNTGKIEEAVEKGKAFLEQHGDVEDTYYPIGEAFLQGGEDEEGLRLLHKCLEDAPYHYYAHLALLKYYLKHPEKIIEAEKSVEVLMDYYSKTDGVMDYLTEAFKVLIPYYEKNIDLEDMENQYRLAKYYNASGDADKCEALCNKLIEKDPSFTKAYYLISKIYVSRDELEKVLDYNNLWIENAKDEDDKEEAYMRRGLIYRYLERYEEALEDFNTVLAHDFEHIGARINKLMCLDLMKKYEELGQTAETFVSGGCREEDIYYYLAKARYEMGDYNRAMDACRECLRISPYQRGAYQIKAKIFYDVDQYEDVLSVIETANYYNIQNDEELMYYEAAALKETNELEKAAEVCKAATDLYQENEKLHYLYALISYRMNENDRAIEFVDKSIALKPLSFKFYLRGDINWRRSQFEQVIKDYQKAIELGKQEDARDEYLADLFDDMGRVYMILEENEKAYESYTEAIKYNPNHKNVYNNLADYYEKKGREGYEKAIEAYTKQIEIDETDYSYVGRGWCYSYLERYEEARADFESALKCNPENGFAMNGIGAIYSNQDNLEEAEKYYRKAIELDDECLIAYENLADCLEDMERYEEAIDVYTAAIEKYPNRVYLHMNKGNDYCQIGEFEKGLQEFALGEQIDASNHYIYYFKGRAYAALDRNQEAIDSYKASLEINEKYVPATYQLAELYDNLEQYEQAVKWYNRVLELDPKNCRAYNNLAVVYGILNQTDQSFNTYKKALEIDSSYYHAVCGLGCCYKDWKQYDKAIEWFKKTIEIEPGYLYAYRMLARCYSNSGQYKEGAICLEKALEIRPDDILTLDELAYLYYNMHQNEKAKAYFEKMLELDEDYDDAYRGLGLISERQKEYEKAYKYYVKATVLSEGRQSAVSALCDLTLEQLKNYEPTLHLLNELNQKGCLEDRTLEYMGQILKAMGNQKEAEPYFQKTMQVLLEEIAKGWANACTYYHLGKCYEGLDQIKEAKKYYMKAIKLGSQCKDCMEKGCYEAYFKMGRLYEKEENYRAALEAYNQAQEINSDSEENYTEDIERVKKQLQEQNNKNPLGKILGLFNRKH